MGTTDFSFEFTSEVPDPGDALRSEALDRLWQLTAGHTDIIGASVAVEELTGEETPHQYQVRAVLFMRPDNIFATEKASTPEGAMKGTLTAAERQVRKIRKKRKETWSQP
jgi:ribosome-associated translation inhibitor RaiA